MKPIFLTGIALWSPGHRDLEAFVAGAEDESVVDCGCPWVPSRLLRGASRLTRMLGHVAAVATDEGKGDPRTISTIYTSSYGEIETMVTLLDAIFAGDGQLSPMRFKNSVHNSASGLGSIGTGNQGFSTALAAGRRSFEAAMIEAFAWLGENGGDLVIAIADDRLPAPLAVQCAREGLAVGLCLRSEPPQEGVIATLDDLRQDDGASSMKSSFLGRALPPRLIENPSAAALPLIEAAMEPRDERISLAFDVPRPFSIRVRPHDGR